MVLAVSRVGSLGNPASQPITHIPVSAFLLWHIMPWIIGPKASQTLGRRIKRSQTALKPSWRSQLIENNASLRIQPQLPGCGSPRPALQREPIPTAGKILDMLVVSGSEPSATVDQGKLLSRI
jgi:hypothetical protein